METETIEKSKSEQDLCDGFGTDKPLRICFVCSGNTCRSPMAAAVTNFLCKGNVYADSCGLNAFAGMPIANYAAAALENAGIMSVPGNDYKNHSSRKASSTIFGSCDRIYGMTSRHTMALITSFPQFAAKFSTMPREISDPFGGTADDYERCLDDIIDCVKEMFLIE